MKTETMKILSKLKEIYVRQKASIKINERVQNGYRSETRLVSVSTLLTFILTACIFEEE